MVAGALAGAVNGLFGAGGGMVLVPLLISYVGLEDKLAFSTAISIILPLSIVSIVVYWLNGTFPLSQAWPYLIGGLAGGLLGGICFRKVSANFLHKALGLFILWGGIKLLI